MCNRCTKSGGVQESVDMFTDTFLPIADIPVDSTTRVAQKPHGAREGGAGRRDAKSVAHTELLPQEGRTVEKRLVPEEVVVRGVASRRAASMRVYALKYQYKTKHAQKEFVTNLRVKT